MTARDLPDQMALLKEVEQFLYLEAELADAHQHDDWFALWTDELLYSVPCTEEEPDPTRAISIIRDNRKLLEERLYRLKGRHAHAQSPRSRLARVVSNVRIESVDAGGIVVRSRFVVGESRLDRQQVWFGSAKHVLVRSANGLRMREKHVFLINSDSTMVNLTFII